MGLPYLEEIFASSACRGAFKLNDEELVPLAESDPAARECAVRTKDLWSSLAGFVPDIGTVIAKRQSGMSIASQKGGVILEASAPVNVGILRAALKNETPVQVADTDLSAFAAGGTRALWNLASWIEGIETCRALRVSVDGEVLNIWARKGKFGLETSVTPQDAASLILSANESDAAVMLSYDVLADADVATEHDPLALFVTDHSDNQEWQFSQRGALTMRPVHASLQMTGRMLSLHAHLQSWSDGEPYEVTILRHTGHPEVIAQSSESDKVRVLLSV